MWGDSTDFSEKSWELSLQITKFESSLKGTCSLKKISKTLLRLRRLSYRRGQIEGSPIGTELCPSPNPRARAAKRAVESSKNFLRCCVVGLMEVSWHDAHDRFAMLPFSHDSWPFSKHLGPPRCAMSGKQRSQELFAQYDDDGGGTEMVDRDWNSGFLWGKFA